MPKHILKTDFNTLKNIVDAIFIDNNLHNSLPSVTNEIQENEINLLKQTLGDERFFFVVNLDNFHLQHCNGVQKWLGYSDSDFSLKFYWERVVHPSAKNALLLVVLQMYKLLCQGVYPLNFMVQRFSTTIPLKHSNGHYVLAKKTSSVFQYDKKNRLLAYVDEFTIIGKFNGQTALNPRMFNSGGVEEAEKQKAIMKVAMEHFIQMKVFAIKELQMARHLAYYPQSTHADLANTLGVSKQTISTYSKRFLSKTRVFFQKNNEELPTTLMAAQYLRQEGIL